MKTFMSIFAIGLLVLSTMTASARTRGGLTSIVIVESAEDSIKQIPGASDARVKAAVNAAYVSQLMKHTAKQEGYTVNQFTEGDVFSVDAAAYGALSIEVGFPFPSGDPCQVRLKVISYRDGSTSVRETLVYNGAINPPTLGTTECED